MFINLKQANMSVEDYLLKISIFYQYTPSLLSNTWDEICSFMIGVEILVREEYGTTILHDDMTLARLMVYDQSIEESKHKRMTRNIKRSGLCDQDQPTFKRVRKWKKNL